MVIGHSLTWSLREHEACPGQPTSEIGHEVVLLN